MALAAWIEHDIECQLRHEEGFLVFANLGTTMATLVFIVPGIATTDAYLSLEPKQTTESPGVAIEDAQGSQIALQAVVAHLLIQPEGEGDIAHIVVAIEGVHTPVGGMALIVRMHAGQTQTVEGLAKATHLGCHEEVLPLLITREAPGVQSKSGSKRPAGADLIVNTHIGSQRGPPNQIGANHPSRAWGIIHDQTVAGRLSLSTKTHNY